MTSLQQSIVAQTQKLMHQKESLILEHQQQINQLENQYARYVQELLAKKAELHAKFTRVFYQRLDRIHQEMLSLSHNMRPPRQRAVPANSGAANIRRQASSRPGVSSTYLLDEPVAIHNEVPTPPPQRRSQRRSARNKSNGPYALRPASPSSVSSDESVCSDEERDQRAFSTNGEFDSNRRRNHNHADNNEPDHDMDIDDENEHTETPNISVSVQDAQCVQNHLHKQPAGDDQKDEEHEFDSNRRRNHNHADNNEPDHDMDIDDENEHTETPNISVSVQDAQCVQNHLHKQPAGDDQKDEEQVPEPQGIASKTWLSTYIQNKENTASLPEQEAIFAKQPQPMITLDMTGLTDDDHEEISDILDKLSTNGMFAKCTHLRIVSPPLSIQQDLAKSIGPLTKLQTAVFDGVSFFPLMKLLANIPEELTMQCMELNNIEIRLPLYPEFETNYDYVDEEEINYAIARILSCKKLTICRWRTPQRFWNDYLAKFQVKFRHSKSFMREGYLRQKVERCPLKSLVFYGGVPKEDDIPHFIMQMLVKHFSSQLESLDVDFVDQDLYKACMPWMFQKTINKNLCFPNLRSIGYAWRDDQSLLLLEIVSKTSPCIRHAKLMLPEEPITKRFRQIMEKLTRSNVKIEQFPFAK
eukprot:CAMPEP_0197072822 /NCGR_PEP_ID=MMETSP1384-20130603/210290_1 /TAXON_ID=29189 /ORGANISM="Ammonia sp." /LENGTH=640 /DNA_ID=CAMNT_0042511643 /DNA_START=58 /DNA_END=1980 /DNA_ORIENTATION=+